MEERELKITREELKSMMRQYASDNPGGLYKIMLEAENDVEQAAIAELQKMLPKTVIMGYQPQHLLPVMKRLKAEVAKDSSPENCERLVREQPLALAFVKNQTVEMCMEAVKKVPSTILLVKDRTQEMWKEALKGDVRLFNYVRGRTPEMWEIVVQRVPSWLVSCKEPTLEICLAAVSSDSLAMRYVKKPSLELCVEVVRKCPRAVRGLSKKRGIEVKQALGEEHFKGMYSEPDYDCEIDLGLEELEKELDLVLDRTITLTDMKGF